MIKYIVEVHIYGLNSHDSELLVRKFKLLDCVYDGLDIQYTLLKSTPNYITFEYQFSNEDDALKFKDIVIGVNFSKSESESCDVNPVLECMLKYRDDDYGG